MSTDKPYIAITAIFDQATRAAQLTMSHAMTFERFSKATKTAKDAGKEIAGYDFIELPIQSKAFAALRDYAQKPKDTHCVYEIFPLSALLDTQVRKVAAQFLASDTLWNLEQAGLLGGVPLNIKLDLPAGWDKSPAAVHEKLVASGAIDLSAEAIASFSAVKNAWDAAT